MAHPRLPSLALACGLASALAGTATAATLTWPGAAPCAATLQACIDGAPEGSVVEVATNGPINESPNIAKSLTLRAAAGFNPVFAANNSIVALSTGSADETITIQRLVLEAGAIRFLHDSTGPLTANVLDNVIQSTLPLKHGIEIATSFSPVIRGDITFTISGNQVTVPPDAGGAGMAVYPIASAVHSGLIRGNLVQMGTSESGGIGVLNQNRTMSVDIVGNTVFGSNYAFGIFSQQSGSAGTLAVRIVNNTVLGQGAATEFAGGISHLTSGTSQALVINNTLVGDRDAVVVAAQDGAQLSGRVANNLIVESSQTGMSLPATFAATMTNGYNLFYGNLHDFADPSFTPGPGTLFAQPVFRALGDYHLRTNSPGINAGRSADVPAGITTDADNKPRIAGPAVDMGVYESLPVSGEATGDGLGDLLLRRSNGEMWLLHSTGTSFAGLETQSNTTGITINDNAAATPYPSSIAVGAFPGTAGKVTATLRGLAHTFPADLDVILVGPLGQKVMLMSDAGSNVDVSGVTLTFDDGAPPLPGGMLASGTYRPVNLEDGIPDVFTAPAPAGPYGAALSAFNGLSPNGTWSLYVRDDQGTDVGSFDGGWTLDLDRAWTSGFVPYRYNVYHADVTGDGLDDLVSRDQGTGDIQVFRSTGTGFVYAPGTGPGGVWSYGWGTSYDLYFGDVTGDGKGDLIGRRKSTGEVYVFPSTGSGFSSAGGLWSYGWSSGYDLYVADVTGDAKADLVARYFGPTTGLTGDIYVGVSTGSSFGSPTRWTYGFSAGYDMFFADATGPAGSVDLKADLVARYAATGQVYVMRSTGGAFVWDSFAPWTVGWSSTYDLVVRDLDRDGRADLVGRHRGNGNVYVARSSGTAFTFLGAWAAGLDTSYDIY